MQMIRADDLKFYCCILLKYIARNISEYANHDKPSVFQASKHDDYNLVPQHVGVDNGLVANISMGWVASN